MIIRNTLIKLLLKLLIAVLIALAVALMVLVGVMLFSHYTQTEDRIQSSPSTGHYIDAFDTKMFVQTSGQKDAKPVVFIHGTGAWSEMWKPFMQQLAANGYYAIALDIPPFGYSLPPASGRYDKVQQAQRILGALDALGIARATFVVHSIGASPLMEALLSQPDRVTKLVMISPALGLESPLTDGADSPLQQWLRKKYISQPIAAGIFTNRLLTTTLVKNFVSEKDKVSEEWVNLYQQPFSLSGSYQQIALWLPELVAGRAAHVSDTPDSYKHISYPVTLIWGVSDSITPISQGRHLQALIPQATLIEIPGGHVPMIEEPTILSNALMHALNE